MILCTKLHYYYWASVAQFTRSEANCTLVRQIHVRLALEVQMIVFIAIRIESGFAIWTVISWSHIFVDRQLGFTNSAKNCFYIPPILGPCLCRMIGSFFMTLIAGIIFFTTFELYSNDIKNWVIMLATSFIIKKLSIYFDRIHFAAKVSNDLRKKKFVWINCNISETNPSNGKWIICLLYTSDAADE